MPIKINIVISVIIGISIHINSTFFIRSLSGVFLFKEYTDKIKAIIRYSAIAIIPYGYVVNNKVGKATISATKEIAIYIIQNNLFFLISISSSFI